VDDEKAYLPLEEEEMKEEDVDAALPLVVANMMVVGRCRLLF
jgi:hypothetical protein